MWIQKLAEDEEISVKKVNGSDNVADILTKNVSAHLINKHSAIIGLSYPAGTAASG